MLPVFAVRLLSTSAAAAAGMGVLNRPDAAPRRPTDKKNRLHRNVRRTRRDGEITELPCKASAWLRFGDVLTVSTGGGGYGAPDRRSAERIDDDARQRRTSARRGSSFERHDAETAK